jgi:drug/metabolite transporter (DMT)-like permease
LPIYNKYVLGSPTATGGYKFPLTLTWIQLAACSVLALIFTIGRNYWPKTKEGGAHVISQLWTPRTLLLLIPAALFAANIALSNMGLFLVNVTAHLALRNSEIVWVVLLAFLFQRERPTLLATLCCVVIAAGVVLMSLFVASEVSPNACRCTVQGFSFDVFCYGSNRARTGFPHC